MMFVAFVLSQNEVVVVVEFQGLLHAKT
uniref:Uncharacterized protein n=1 Tax=Rhizophora mucronata TaxID=61149 RepID=A0A2P2IJU6_RHIMU